MRGAGSAPWVFLFLREYRVASSIGSPPSMELSIGRGVGSSGAVGIPRPGLGGAGGVACPRAPTTTVAGPGRVG